MHISVALLNRQTPSQAADRRLWLVACLVLGAALLCAATLINGGPVMYPDTLNYLADGHGLIRLTTPDNTRPVFYGLAIELLHWERWTWPVAAAQALIVAQLVHLTLRTVLGAVAPLTLLGVLALLAAFTPVSWYVAHLLPDVFSGVLALGMFLLTFGRARLGRVEIGFVFLITTAAICFHLTNIVTAAALCGGAWAAWLLARVGRPGLPSAALALALIALLSSSFALYHRLSLAPKSPPHLMARLIADGPGRDYLEQSCPERHFLVCADLDRLPRTENGILWRYMAGLSDADGARFRADAGAVVEGTLRNFPAAVAGHMLLNTVRQLVTIDSGTEMDGYWWAHFTSPEFMVRAVAGTLQQRGRLDPLLAALNVLHAAAAVVAGLGCAVVFVRSRDPAVRALLATVALALVANAFAAGALGGVFGRYQGRIVWLVPAAAIIGALALRNQARAAVDPRDATGLRRRQASPGRGWGEGGSGNSSA